MSSAKLLEQLQGKLHETSAGALTAMALLGEHLTEHSPTCACGKPDCPSLRISRNCGVAVMSIVASELLRRQEIGTATEDDTMALALLNATFTAALAARGIDPNDEDQLKLAAQPRKRFEMDLRRLDPRSGDNPPSNN